MPVVAGPRRLRDALFVPVGCFVVVGAMAPAYSFHRFDPGLFVWQLVIGWPIGAALLLGPVALLRGSRSRAKFIAGEAAIALSGAISVVIVNRTDDAQAGIALLWAPIFGCAAVFALRSSEWLRDRAGRSAEQQIPTTSGK